LTESTEYVDDDVLRKDWTGALTGNGAGEGREGKGREGMGWELGRDGAIMS
jgi:hypothetical protein